MRGRTKNGVVLILAAAGLLVAGLDAQAQTASANFQVTANVVNRCTISAANLAFGAYDPTSAAPLNGQSDLTVSCTRGHTAWIGLNDGLYFSGTRRMQNAAGTEWLPYGLYTDAGRTSAWGNTPGTGFSYVSVSRAPQAVPVYGQIPAAADVTLGNFVDTVQATINF